MQMESHKVRQLWSNTWYQMIEANSWKRSDRGPQVRGSCDFVRMEEPSRPNHASHLYPYTKRPDRYYGITTSADVCTNNSPYCILRLDDCPSDTHIESCRMHQSTREHTYRGASCRAGGHLSRQQEERKLVGSDHWHHTAPFARFSPASTTPCNDHKGVFGSS
jgi:hypothetical protein